MRGLTMILVVYSHVCNYCLGDRMMALNDVLFLFRMPCFFFISGWLFEKPEREWSLAAVKEVVRKKFMVQIVPTFIFLMLLAPPPLFFSRLGATKGGYWFTFALFEYFVLYMLTARMGRRGSWLVAVVVSVAAFCYDIFYGRMVASAFFHPLVFKMLGFLGFMTWRFYLFFFLGTVVKRHFGRFLELTDSPSVLAGVAAAFALVALIPQGDSMTAAFLRFFAGGLFGTLLVFTLFRLCYADRQSPLLYIGTRTLDIYLLHYFFLPRFLLPFGDELRSLHCLPAEIVVALALALIVTAISLLVSRLLRTSPFLAHYLFGVK